MDVLYHGSYRSFKPGDVLRNLDPTIYAENWSGSGFYEILEQFRPVDCLPHAEAVFACGNIPDINGYPAFEVDM